MQGTVLKGAVSYGYNDGVQGDAILALGHVAIAMLLWHRLELKDLGVLFGALAGSILVARVCVAGASLRFSKCGLTLGSPCPSTMQAAFSSVLLRWLMCVCTFGTLWMTGRISLFQDVPIAAVMMPCLGLSIALSWIAQASVTAAGYRFGWHRGFVCWALYVGLVYIAQHAGVTSPEAYLALALAVSILLLITRLPLLLADPADTIKTPPKVDFITPASVAMQHTDIMLCLVLLPSGAALIYLVARSLAQIVPFVFKCLSQKLLPHVSDLYISANLTAFKEAAARINLGFLLIGGGTALVALCLVKPVALVLMLAEGHFATSAIWLVLGFAAPVVFGASSLFLSAIKQRRIAFTIWVGATLAALSAVAFTQPSTPVELALIIALMQVGVTAVSAVWVIHTAGIWPGITGLLCNQIKLL